MAKLPFEYVKKPDIDWIEEEKKRREQEEKLQRVQNYFAGVAQNSINLQNEANFYQKYAEERKDLLKSIDKPTPQEVEQVNPLSSILNYTPVNPNYTLNWANAISSWMGNKPTYQTWNPDFDANYNQVLINKLNEAHEHKIIANKKPEDRTPEEFEKLSSFVANKIKSGEYNTAKKILQSMPENFKLLPPEEKLKQIQGTTPIEQAYLNWKQNYLAKIKKGEEERYNQMNIGEKMMKDSENIEGNDWYSNFKRELLGGIGSVIHNVYSPIKGGVEKVNKAVEAPPSAKNLINTVGGFIDTVFSIGMAPLNAMTGLAQKSLVKDQYNLLNNATMQLLGMPGEVVAKVAEKLGVEDPELLQSLSTLGNTAALMIGPAMKGRLAKGIQEGVMKKVAEAKKLNEVNQLQKLEKAVDPVGTLKEAPKPESLPIGEKLVKETIEAETKPIEQKGVETAKPVQETTKPTTEVKPTNEPIPQEAIKPTETVKETPQKAAIPEETKPVETTTVPEEVGVPKEPAIPEINKAKIEELTKQRDLADKEAAMLLEDESMFDPKEVAELKERVKQTGKTEREYAVEKLNEVEKLDEQIKELEKSKGVIDSGYIPEEVKPIEEAKPTEAIKPEEAVKPVEEVKQATEAQPKELAKPIPEEVKPQEAVKPIEEVKTPETVEPIKEIKAQEAIKPEEAAKPTTEVKPQEKPTERPSFAEEYSKRFRISHLQESFFKIVAEAYEDPVRRAKGEHIQHIDNFIKRCQEAQKNGSLIGNDELVKNLANPEFAANFKQEILNDLPKYYETYKQKYGIIENENTGVKLDETKGTNANKVVEVNTKDINVHPKMQFKSLADESGITKRDRLEAQEYNPAYAGVYAVWEDPKTGKTYVVDGHHRLDLAKRKGVEKVPAYYIEAKDINDARAQGAMINIANNRGIPIDVARISKENGWGVEDFKKNNIDVKNSNVLKQGMELAKLSDDLLDKVEKSYLYDKTKSIVDNNLLPEKYAVIIGEEAPIPLELSQKKANKKTPMNELAEYEKIATIQRQAFEYLKENPKVDPETFREIIREKVNSGTAEKTGEQSSMFGELTTKYENERAELRADFEKQINYDISTSNIVKNTKKAKSIQEKGLGELKTEEGKKLNEELNRIKEVYTKEKYSGELAQLTNEYAKKLSEVKNDRAGREQIKREFNERVREAIRNRYREEGQNVAEHKGVPDSSTSLFGEPEKTTATTTEAPKQLRKIEEIPLEKDKAENFNVGDRFFDKKGEMWIVKKKFEDGSFMAEGGKDANTGKIKNTIFKGDIKIRGKNAPETGFSGEMPYKGATENALRTLAELELNKKKIYKDNPNYNIELDKELKKTYVKYNLANYERLPLIKRIERKLQEFRNYATQRYNLDYNDPKQAYASYIFRNMEAGLSYSIHKTKEAIYHTLKPLMEVKDGVEKFSMYRVLRTLKHDIDSGLYSYKKKDPAQIEALEGQYKQLPFGWTKEFVMEEFSKLDKEFKENPYLKAANDIWDNYWEEVTAEGVKAGVLPKEVLKNKDYMHKQINEYYAALMLEDDFSIEFSKYTKSRKGSNKDFNTNWTMASSMVMQTIIQRTQRMMEFKRLMDKVDIRKELIDKAKNINSVLKEGEKAIKDIKELIPDNYTVLNIDPKSDFASLKTNVSKYAEAKIGANLEKDIKAPVKTFIIPKEIAEVINKMRFNDPDPLNRVFKLLDKGFKVNVLYNPTRYIKYEMRNAYSDISKLLSVYPGAFAKIGESFRELKSMWSDKGLSADINEAIKKGVIESGLNAKEFKETFRSFTDRDIQALFDPNKRGTLEQYNVFKKIYKASVDLNNFRENLMRLATYKYVKERLNKGDKIYGASNYKVVDALTDISDKAALISRELLVDYGNSTQLANRFARGVVPFYRWIEGNAKGITNIIRNIAHEDGGLGKLGRGTMVGTATLGMKAIKYLALSQVLYGAVQLWNRMTFPDAYNKLNMTQNRRGDLIIYQKDDGTLLTLPLETAMNDFLGYVGLDDWLTDLTDYLYGRRSVKDILEKVVKSPLNKFIQSALPLPKMVLEASSGKSYWDVLNPAPIIDNSRYWARALQIEPLYRAYRQMIGEGFPERGGKEALWYNILGSAVWNEVNVNELAYNMIRGRGYDYNKQKRDKPAAFDQKNERELALYYMKLARKYKDYEAEERYKNKYIELSKKIGMSMSDINKAMNTSIKNMHPLAMIAKRDREDFVNNFLTPYEREVLKMAEEYYNGIYQNNR